MLDILVDKFFCMTCNVVCDRVRVWVFLSFFVSFQFITELRKMEATGNLYLCCEQNGVESG